MSWAQAMRSFRHQRWYLGEVFMKIDGVTHHPFIPVGLSPADKGHGSTLTHTIKVGHAIGRENHPEESLQANLHIGGLVFGR